MSDPANGSPRDVFARERQEHIARIVEDVMAGWNDLSHAVDALQQVQATGAADEQAVALRDAMRVLFPEAVALVSAARQGFMRQ